MTLSAATLATELENLTPTTSEATAIQRLVDAWEAYFAQSSVNGITATPGSFNAGLTAMSGAMAGLSLTNNGSTAIQSGVTAFWAAIAGLATTIWITAPVVLVPPIVPPPTLTAVAASLDVTFANNLASELNLSDAALAVATTLHTTAGLGAVVPGSVPPAAPVPLPIL